MFSLAMIIAFAAMLMLTIMNWLRRWWCSKVFSTLEDSFQNHTVATHTARAFCFLFHFISVHCCCGRRRRLSCCSSLNRTVFFLYRFRVRSRSSHYFFRLSGFLWLFLYCLIFFLEYSARAHLLLLLCFFSLSFGIIVPCSRLCSKYKIL